jgi:hypothetical protein
VKAPTKLKLVGLHLRISEELLGKLLARLADLRKKDPMVTLSDAARLVLEKGLGKR